jgi:hypothetical protein
MRASVRRTAVAAMSRRVEQTGRLAPLSDLQDQVEDDHDGRQPDGEQDKPDCGAEHFLPPSEPLIGRADGL